MAADRKDQKVNFRRHLALYGSVALAKGHCNICNLDSFIIDNKYQCCDSYAAITPYNSYIRYSQEVNIRKQPSAIYKQEQLIRQENKCFYCGLILEDPQWNSKKRKVYYTIIHWDHSIPFLFLKQNKDIYFVASCSICNGIKSAKLFHTAEESRAYVIKRRKEKGFNDFEDLPELLGTFYYEKEEQKILLPNLSIPSMGQSKPKSKTISRFDEAERRIEYLLRLTDELILITMNQKAELLMRIPRRISNIRRCLTCNVELGNARRNKIYCSSKCNFRHWALKHPRFKISQDGKPVLQDEVEK